MKMPSNCRPVSYIYFCLILMHCNWFINNILLSYWWRLDVVTLQGAIHGEKELEILIVFTTKKWKAQKEHA